MRKNLKMAAAAFALSLICSWSAAQEVKSIVSALTELDSADQSLAKIFSNLNEMNATTRDSDQAQVEVVLSNIERVQNYTQQVTLVATIYTNMIDRRDTDIVRRFLSLSCRSFERTNTRASASINKVLPHIYSPALVQEISKARDQIGILSETKICKIVPAWKN